MAPMEDEGSTPQPAAATRRDARLIEALFAQALSCIAIFDREFRYVRVNAAYAHHYRRPLESFPGLEARAFARDIGNTAAEIEQGTKLLETVMSSRQPSVVFGRPYRFGDQPERGEMYWDITIQPILDERGEVEYLCWTANDVSERVRAAEEVRALNRDLESRVAERTSDLEAFAFSVSHDLRAPVHHIEGYLDLALSRAGQALDDESKRYITVAQEEARRMEGLIAAILTFSRLGRCEMATEDVDLGELTREVIERCEPETRGRTIRWDIGELPTVSGDPTMLTTAMSNLVSNAIKFSRTRQPAEIAIGSRQQDGETVIFVRDNGVGFDMKYVGKLFGVFQRLHGVTEFEGTGIGLALVQRVVKRHGGRVWAEAAVDKGATFSFALPR